jgi:hypothetical protein
VIEAQVYGDLLHIFVDAAQQRMPQLKAALQAAGVQVNRMRVIRPRMEEAFISLIRKQGEEARQTSIVKRREANGDA